MRLKVSKDGMAKATRVRSAQQEGIKELRKVHDDFEKSLKVVKEALDDFEAGFKTLQSHPSLQQVYQSYVRPIHQEFNKAGMHGMYGKLHDLMTKLQGVLKHHGS